MAEATLPTPMPACCAARQLQLHAKPPNPTITRRHLDVDQLLCRRKLQPQEVITIMTHTVGGAGRARVRGLVRWVPTIPMLMYVTLVSCFLFVPPVMQAGRRQRCPNLCTQHHPSMTCQE